MTRRTTTVAEKLLVLLQLAMLPLAVGVTWIGVVWYPEGGKTLFVAMAIVYCLAVAVLSIVVVRQRRVVGSSRPRRHETP